MEDNEELGRMWKQSLLVAEMFTVKHKADLKSKTSKKTTLKLKEPGKEEIKPKLSERNGKIRTEINKIEK